MTKLKPLKTLTRNTVEVLGFNTAPAPGELFEFSPSEKGLDNWLKKMKLKTVKI